MRNHSRPINRLLGQGNRPGLAARWLLALALALTANAKAASFTATIEPEIIALGSAATLKLRFQDCSPSDTPQLPEVPDLRFTHVGRGSEMTMVPGRVSQTLVISYQITSSKTGTYTIPPITATVDGRRLATQPLTLTVAPTDPTLARIAFLTLAFPKERYYVGESTAADIHLHAQGGSVARLPSLSGEGAIFGTNVSLGQAIRVATNNGIFSRLAWRVPVTFAKAGDFTYTAQDAQLRVEIRTPQRGNSIWSLLPDIETHTLHLASTPVQLEIRPLPNQNLPPTFSGAVGRFSLDARIGSTNATVGDPLTVTVRISGQGNLPAVRWSAPTHWSGLRAYEPTSQLETADPLGLTGTRVFEQVLIPESTALREIPPLQFTFFNPATESYETASHPGFPLSVLPAATPTAQPLVAAPGTSNPAAEPVDIVHIKNQPGTLAVLSSPLLMRPGFVALQILPLLAWGGSALLRRRREFLLRNPRHVRRIEVNRSVKQGLANLRQHAAAQRADAFYAELHHLLQEQLGEKLDLPASAISSEIVEHRLRGSLAHPDLVEAVELLFRHCDLARYAPQTTGDNLSTVLNQAETTLKQIQNLPLLHAH